MLVAMPGGVAPQPRDRDAVGVDSPSSERLRGGAHEYLAQRDALGAADGDGNDFGDVSGGDVRVGGRLLRGTLAVGLVMWLVSSVATAPGSMTMTRMSGCSPRRSDFDQPFIPTWSPRRRRSRRERCGRRPRTLTRSPPPSRSCSRKTSVAVIAPIRLVSTMRRCCSLPFEAQGCEQHDTGVVHEDVGSAELLVDALGRALAHRRTFTCATPSRALSRLLDVCRLWLWLLDLLQRLGGSLVDIERELGVVVIDPNAIVRLQRSAQQ
jgi:hypothetical protein